MLSRSEMLARTGVTDEELHRLEQERLVIPRRSWKSLWLYRHYLPSQVDVIAWLVSCKRTSDAFRERERRLVTVSDWQGSWRS
jgi:hypothetical protein